MEDHFENFSLENSKIWTGRVNKYQRSQPTSNTGHRGKWALTQGVWRVYLEVQNELLRTTWYIEKGREEEGKSDHG